MNYIPRTRTLFVRSYNSLRNPAFVRFASTGEQKGEKVAYQSSEKGKVNIATEVTDKDGTHTKSSKKWDSDLASNSEEIVHAERKDAKKNQSIEEMQDNTVKKVQEKEKKLEGVDKKEVSDK